MTTVIGVAILTKLTTGSSSGQLTLRNSANTSILSLLSPTSILFNKDGFRTVLSYSSITKNNDINIPDSSGTLPLRVKLNSTTYSAANNGTIDLGTITSTPDSSIFATRFWVNSTFQPIGNYITTGSNGSLQSLTITGTNGNGHIHLRHQASLPTATGQSTVIYANSNGDFAYKNDGNYHTTFVTSANTADRSYTFQNKSYTVADNAEVMKYIDTVSLSNRIDAKQDLLTTRQQIHLLPVNQQLRRAYRYSTEFEPIVVPGNAALTATNVYHWGHFYSYFNTATNTSFAVVSSSTYVNALQLGTAAGTTTSTYATTSMANGSVAATLNSDTLTQEWRVQVPTLNDGTDRFFCTIGFGNSGTALTNAVAFVYDLTGSMTGSASSTNWQVVTAAASSRSWTTTSVTVTAGQWYKLTTKSITGRVEFYIDDVLVRTETTNVPTAGLLQIIAIQKTAGANNRTILADYNTMERYFINVK